jgi:glycosyltransferase involved in cell wall biosynthesis
MRIYLDNVDLRSTSGPNSFAKKLIHELSNNGHEFTALQPHVQLSFIVTNKKCAPTALRLDGIYFNTAQDWEQMNEYIQQSYRAAELVIFQSHFNKELTTKYFGPHPNTVVVHNGANLDLIAKTPINIDTFLDPFEKVWLCASAWRPHKRLAENIRYFKEHATGRDCLIIAGSGSREEQAHENDPRIIFVGDLNQIQLTGIMKRADYFIHLALLDHCPNVVVDARATNCKIICASSGGTHEIAGSDAIVIQDIEWDWKPFELYAPPMLDFSKKLNIGRSAVLDMAYVANQYAMSLNKIALR